MRYGKLLGYIIFTIVVGCFFLYVFFPCETTREYLESSVTRISTAFSFNIGKLRPSPPFSLRLEDAVLTYQKEPYIPLFKADVLVLTPSIQTITEGKPIIAFSCKAYEGKLDGFIGCRTFSLKGPFNSTIRIKDVRLEQYPMLKEKLQRNCSGAIHGMVTYAFPDKDLSAGSGEADLYLTNGKIQFVRPFLGIKAIDYDQMHASLKLTGQKVLLDRFVFEGEKIEAEAHGTIHLNSHLGRSKLDLTVMVKPLSGFFGGGDGAFDATQLFFNQFNKDRFNIQVLGTVTQPRFKFI